MSDPALKAAFEKFVVEARAALAVPGASAETSITGKFDAFLEAALSIVSKKQLHLVQQTSAEAGVPDFRVNDGNELLGWVEFKAVVGKDLRDLKGHDKDQKERFVAGLHNWVLTDGWQWELYREGQRIKSVVFDSQLFAADILLEPSSSAFDDLEHLLELFVTGQHGDYTTVDAAVVALALRAKGLKLALVELGPEQAGTYLLQLYSDFESLLYRNMQPFAWSNFVDSYVQIATFGVLLWRLESKTEIDLGLQVVLKAGIHPLLEQCLRIMWSPDSQVPMLKPMLEELCRTVNRIPPHLFTAAPKSPGNRRYVPDAIVHAYEPFFRRYDPAAREANGVYYTPVEIVQQIVSGVDELLRTSMGRKAGILDDDARFLDPATGTGTFLLGLANEIALEAEKAGLPTDQVVHEVLTTRTSAFELFPGPYTIAHQRLESLLDTLGTPATQRLPIYLADTLAAPESGQLPLSGFGPAGEEILEERERADWVKTKEKILVVLGNPPYERLRVEGGGWDVFAAYLMQQVVDATPVNKRTDLKSATDLYVAFWAWALWALRPPEDRQATSQHPLIKGETNHGIIAFITNRTWIIGPSLVGLRNLVRKGVQEVWVYDLGGDNRGGTGAKSYKKGDQNVFGIQTGVAIVWLVYNRDRDSEPIFRYRRIFGSKADKLEVLAEPFNPDLFEAIDDADLFVPVNWPDTLVDAPALPQVFRYTPFTGVQSARDTSDYSPWSPEKDGVYAELMPKKGQKRLLFGNLGRWAELTAKKQRQSAWSTAQSRRSKKQVPEPSSLRAEKVRKAFYRPLDERYLYDDPAWVDWYREDLHAIYRKGPIPTLITLPRDYGAGPLAVHTVLLPDQHAFRGQAGGKGVFPLWLPAEGLDDDGRAIVNGRLCGFVDPVIDWATETFDGSADPILDAYAYMLAVLSAPAYADRFWVELEAQPPRMPLTADREVATDLAAAGHRLRAAWEKDAATDGIKWSGQGTGPLGIAKFSGGTIHFDNGRSIVGVPAEAWTLKISLYEVLPQWFAARTHWTATMSQAREALSTIAAAIALVAELGNLDVLFDRVLAAPQHALAAASAAEEASETTDEE